jgi:ParB family chromosome partitioning protein
MAGANVADQLKSQLDATANRIKNPQAADNGRIPADTDRPKPAVVRLADIEVDPNQPRKDVGDIDDLVASIEEHGLLQPLIVSSTPAGNEKRYRLIAGERRYRACQQLNLDTVPAIIRSPNEQQRLQIQLIENLHRKNLDAFEESNGYKRLKDEFNLTDKQTAKSVHKSRTHVTQTLTLSKIPSEIRVKCQRADIPLSRDTLYLIAKQPSVEKMRQVFQDSQNALTREDRRERARKGEPRSNGATKPKQVFPTTHGFTVILQSDSSKDISREQRIAGLTEVLKRSK